MLNPLFVDVPIGFLDTDGKVYPTPWMAQWSTTLETEIREVTVSATLVLPSYAGQGRSHSMSVAPAYRQNAAVVVYPNYSSGQSVGVFPDYAKRSAKSVNPTYAARINAPVYPTY